MPCIFFGVMLIGFAVRLSKQAGGVSLYGNKRGRPLGDLFALGRRA